MADRLDTALPGETRAPSPTAATAPRRLIDGAGRLFDYWVITYLRTWKGSVITSFVTPLLYVLAMGVLLGGFIEGDPEVLEGATSYLAFVAPGLVAAQAMQLAIGETTYPVMGMVKWNKTYYGMIATPLSSGAIVAAQLGFLLFRVGTSCAVFLVVMAPFGVFSSVAGVLGALLVQLLIGAAFAAPVLAYSVGAKSEAGFSLIYRLGVVPLFLFSGAFFPIANLGDVLSWIARLTPLWQGVNLTRMLTVGPVDWSLAAVNVAYLALLTVVFTVVATRRLHRRLIV